MSGSEFYGWLFGPEKFSGLSRNGPMILGLRARDKADMHVGVQNYSKKSLRFCIMIESNSPKTFFPIVLYSNMAAVTSGANQEYHQSISHPGLFSAGLFLGEKKPWERV